MAYSSYADGWIASYPPGSFPKHGDPWTQDDFRPEQWAEIQRILAEPDREITLFATSGETDPQTTSTHQRARDRLNYLGYINRRDAGVPGYTHGTGHYIFGSTFDRIATGAVVVGLAAATAYVGAGAAGLISAPAAGGVEGGALLSTAESSLPVVAGESTVEFSLAGSGSGVGLGGETYGLGLSAEGATFAQGAGDFSIGLEGAGGVGLQAPLGAAELLAPSLSSPLTYPVAAGIGAPDVIRTVKTVKDAVQPVLSVGRQLRAVFGGGDAPGSRAPGAGGPGDDFSADALWTAGAFAAAGLLFALVGRR